jgi:ABC-type Zn uptake system ZnuABC Zn-binding protein ZnuA
MEEFIDSLKKANPAMTMVDTSVGIETMEGTCDHDHGDGKAGEEHVHAQNPHFFSSPKRAIQQVKNIVARLAEIDPPHADLYRKNGDAYIAKLEAVSNKIVEARKSLKSNELVTMHGIFDYLAQDYDLDIVGNLQADHNVDPSANKMKKLVELIKKEKVKAVFTEPQYPTAPAEALAKAAGVKVATLDPVAAGPADAPLDYYESIMTKNIDVLIDVLGR